MDDDVMAPMVDALTGAMAAILLVSIFLMVSTLSSVVATVKEYGKNALYENEILLSNIFDLEPPILELDKQRIIFFKSFDLTEEQIHELQTLFQTTPPKKLLLYSDSSESVVTFNALQFLLKTGLNTQLDNINFQFLKARSGVMTEFVWEF